MPLNGMIKHGRNLQMVKFHVIHISQLLKEERKWRWGSRQEEEEEERRQREPQRRVQIQSASERRAPQQGAPRRRGWRGHSTQRRPSSRCSHAGPKWEGPLFPLSMAGAVMVTGTLCSSRRLWSPLPHLLPVLPNTTTLPHHHICQSKSNWPNLLLGLFLYHTLNLHFYYRKFKAQKKIDKTQKKIKVSHPATEK